MDMEWVKLLLAVLSGLSAAIPLVVKLAEYVRKAAKEKNWNVLLALVMKLMGEAESKFTDGADRKQWVLAMVKASADTINYDVDMDEVGSLIDSLCDMSKRVNTAEYGKESGE